MLLLCSTATSWVHADAHCRQRVLSFVENDPWDLNDADLTIARLRLLPSLQDRCSGVAVEALARYGKLLDDEFWRRTAGAGAS